MALAAPLFLGIPSFLIAWQSSAMQISAKVMTNERWSGDQKFSSRPLSGKNQGTPPA
jgi:hypothetical protein